MEYSHQPGDIIKERYRILDILGKGGISITYKALDEQTEEPVAIKGLSLRQTQDWKIIELFEREARVLQNLNHPAIPNYLDYFQIDTDEDRYFYIVQEVAEGQSLSEWIEQGWRPTEKEVRNIAQQVLEIIGYLHQFNPPVIHRDIKPQNIIRQSDGKVYLVDFGAVKDTYRQTMTGGSTVVGTYGYMAPEQFRGQAKPATDLYGLAATLLFLLTRTSPADLPEKRLKIDFRSAVKISEDLADWLERMLEPAPEDRFKSAEEANGVLQGKREIIHPLIPSKRQPAGSKIMLKKTAYKLIVEIPPSGLRVEMIPMGCFSIFWLGFVFIWTLGAIAMGAPFFFPLFSIPFWMVGFTMVGGLFYSVAGHNYLEIDREKFCLQWKCLWFRRTVEGNTADLTKLQIKNSNFKINDRPVINCELIEGVRSHHFGSMLTQVEKEWLMAEVNDFLRNPN